MRSLVYHAQDYDKSLNSGESNFMQWKDMCISHKFSELHIIDDTEKNPVELRNVPKNYPWQNYKWKNMTEIPYQSPMDLQVFMAPSGIKAWREKGFEFKEIKVLGEDRLPFDDFYFAFGRDSGGFEFEKDSAVVQAIGTVWEIPTLIGGAFWAQQTACMAMWQWIQDNKEFREQLAGEPWL